MLKRINGTSIMKKTAAFTLSLVMASGAFAALPGGAALDMFSISASAAETGTYSYRGNTFSYTINGREATVTSCGTKVNKAVVIPEKITTSKGTYTVTAVGDGFGARLNTTTVTIPNTVKTIGNTVFCYSTIDTLNISNNLEKIGAYFCFNSDIRDAHCYSKALKYENIGPYCFYMYNDAPENRIILGDWLIKYDTNKSTLDLTSFEFDNITLVSDYAFWLGGNIKTLKVNDRSAVFMEQKNFANDQLKKIDRVYYNGKELVCTSKDQLLPDFMAQNNDLSGDSEFALKFANDKAKCLLNSMGLTYYGSNSSFFKGKQSAEYEYRAVKKIHDYMVRTYTFDEDTVFDPYLKSFNCGTSHVCNQDARLSAFLLENAGVETEVITSGVPYATTSEDAKAAAAAGWAAFIHPEENICCKIDKWGYHAWNYVRVGGDWYHFDSTTSRRTGTYQMFLSSDDFVRDYVVCGADVHANAHPMYDYIPQGPMRFFQQHNDPMEALPACTHLHGDVNATGYTDRNDLLMLQVYLMLPEDIQNKVLNRQSLTESENKIANDCRTYVEEHAKYCDEQGIEYTGSGITFTDPTTGEYLYYDRYAMDVNFDGVIDMADAVELERCLMCTWTVNINN